jgi:hypothetical protein
MDVAEDESVGVEGAVVADMEGTMRTILSWAVGILHRHHPTDTRTSMEVAAAAAENTEIEIAIVPQDGPHTAIEIEMTGPASDVGIE